MGLAIVLDGFGRLKLGHEGARGSFALGFLLMALGLGVIVLAYWLTHARRDWAAGEQGAVAARPRVHLGLPWGMALLCLAFVGFLLPSGWQELRPERLLQNPRALALLALTAPFVWAVIQTLHRWRSAEVVFVPGQRATMGGQLRGTLHTRLRHRPRGSVTLTLSCLSRSIAGDRQVRETEETIWQSHHEVAVGHLRTGADGLSIPVSIPLPKAGSCRCPVGGPSSGAWPSGAGSPAPIWMRPSRSRFSGGRSSRPGDGIVVRRPEIRGAPDGFSGVWHHHRGYGFLVPQGPWQIARGFTGKRPDSRRG